MENTPQTLIKEHNHNVLVIISLHFFTEAMDFNQTTDYTKVWKTTYYTNELLSHALCHVSHFTTLSSQKNICLDICITLHLEYTNFHIY